MTIHVLDAHHKVIMIGAKGEKTKLNYKSTLTGRKTHMSQCSFWVIVVYEVHYCFVS